MARIAFAVVEAACSSQIQGEKLMMSCTLMSENVLIERAQMGDRFAFDQLVRSHMHRAYQYAYNLTRDPEEAEDVVAETCLRMFKSISQFKQRSAFNTWMYRITMNCYLDRRKFKFRGQHLSLDATLAVGEQEFATQYVDNSASAFDVVAMKLEMESLRAALEKLPSWQSSILLSYHADSKSYSELSESLGVPIGTVKSRLNRARRSLAMWFRPDRA
jgi:RNA polymerase sigma-70 factor, ECF subfamily